ncbi:MAG: hypothetical protein ACE5OZ_04315 [Candidatus Heimdallarchaeota archaeon]
MVRVSTYLMKKYCHWYNYCQRNPCHWDHDQQYPGCAARFGCFTQEEWTRLRSPMGITVQAET